MSLVAARRLVFAFLVVLAFLAAVMIGVGLGGGP